MKRLPLFFVIWIAHAATIEGCIGFCGGGSANDAEVSLHVSDSTTGKPVSEPTFRMNDVQIQSTCGEPDRTDPQLCTSDLIIIERGEHEIEVSAPGYRGSTVEVDTGDLDSVHISVSLQPVS
jgi:hypothetical protein